MLPKTALNFPGARQLPGPRHAFPGPIELPTGDVTDFVRVGMESVQVTYNFLGLCHLWAVSTFLWLAFDAYVPTEVDGYLCRAHRQPSPVIHIKPLRILLQGMNML